MVPWNFQGKPLEKWLFHQTLVNFHKIRWNFHLLAVECIGIWNQNLKKKVLELPLSSKVGFRKINGNLLRFSCNSTKNEEIHWRWLNEDFRIGQGVHLTNFSLVFKNAHVKIHVKDQKRGFIPLKPWGGIQY